MGLGLMIAFLHSTTKLNRLQQLRGLEGEIARFKRCRMAYKVYKSPQGANNPRVRSLASNHLSWSWERMRGAAIEVKGSYSLSRGYT